ncbi:MAG: Nitroreductase [Candidatus Gottesmanbacteria bacterium GW2011_GWC2_39_8]|uniref:Nitroreductase n=1 Tax=Candidatus Gottesmanbacteria bacterium GW2011_GWC2_39_8 TaxID=1618450 RepID=A0A0G0Q2Q2_9BACT|nr:MAG: Nitroreductase [Candidatus Gottesmanbacteria bacterium GW2011_GWC2_39_8]
MDFFEAVQKRVAVRQYISGMSIPKEDLDKILEAARQAPSAGNLQSYKIYVIDKEKDIKEVAKFYRNQKSEFIPSSSAILFFCPDPDRANERYPEKKDHYSLQDATISQAFAILAATSLGYGSCWAGSFDARLVADFLKTDLIPAGSLIIGYPNEKPERKERKPIEELVIYK